jgi:DNA-binding FrmR family transcriptional regulator
MFFKKKKVETANKHFILQSEDKQKVVNSINKIIGQLETIRKDVLNDSACDESIVQILAIKGGVESVGRYLVGKGILDCISNYTREELESIIKNIFKLD